MIQLLKTLLILGLLSLICSSLLSAGDSQELRRFRVVLKDGDRFEGKRGIIKGDSLIGQSFSGLKVGFALNDINTLQLCTGDKAIRDGLLGILAGGLVSLPICIQEEDDPRRLGEKEFREDYFFAFTAAGFVIGLIVGSHERTWENIPINAGLGFNDANQQARLSLRFRF